MAQKLPCVLTFEEKGDTLYIRVLQSRVDEYALRELLALFPAVQNRYEAT